MSDTLYNVSMDGRYLAVEMSRHREIFLTRDEAVDLLNVLQEALPKMAVKTETGTTLNENSQSTAPNTAY